MRGARKTAPRIHPAETGAGDNGEPLPILAAALRPPQARAPPRFRAQRENLRRIVPPSVLPPDMTAKENPAMSQTGGV